MAETNPTCGAPNKPVYTENESINEANKNKTPAENAIKPKRYRERKRLMQQERDRKLERAEKESQKLHVENDFDGLQRMCSMVHLFTKTNTLHC